MNKQFDLKTVYTNKSAMTTKIQQSLYDTFFNVSQLKSRIVNLNNAAGRKFLFSAFVNMMQKYWSLDSVIQVLNLFSIGTADSFSMQVSKYASILTAQNVRFDNIKIIVDKKSSTYKNGKKFVKKFGKGKNPYEVSEIDMTDIERTVVCRTKYGTREPLMYTIKGAMSVKTANYVKAGYAFETGENYYDCRPILYTSWIKLSPEYQMASHPLVEDELKHVME